MKLFDAFKQYIVKHPKVAAYKPTSADYDRDKLFAIVKKLVTDDMMVSKEETKKVLDFLWISDMAHRLYQDFYQVLNDLLPDFNMEGEDVVEYFIAFLNQEHKAALEKVKEAYKNMPKGTYMLHDMTTHKMELPNGAKVDLKAAMEGATDATSMLCNYMRHHLKDQYKNENSDPNCFAGMVRNLYQMADMMATFKHSYDDVLYDKTFVRMTPDDYTIVFDDDDYHNEKLKALGQLIIGERVLHVRCQNRDRGRKSELEKYVKPYRVKRTKVSDGLITLEFGQGEAKRQLEFMKEMQAAIDAYYEFLDINMTLVGINGITLAEVLGVWVALQCICHEVTEHWHPVSKIIYTKEEFGEFPRKIKAVDLEAYLVKMTGVKIGRVRHVLKALEADWSKYNYIWSSPLYKIKDYYCLPFIPIINCMPYNIIETVMQRGGYDLEKRGKDFEQYVYKQIAGAKHEYEVNCIASRHYGEKKEEIDLLIGLRDIVVLAEAKCIHYSMEPQNYGDAWDRLTHGAEQALRKKAYMEAHPEMYTELGDVTKKKIVPVVLTNYPIYAGFEHNGVSIIDSHTFISYFVAGYMTMRTMSKHDDPIQAARFFYNSEAGMSANFEKYLKNQPVKQMHIEKMVIDDIPLLPMVKPWKCTAKTAVYKGNPGFDISAGAGI
jgi:hypothetical protein